MRSMPLGQRVSPSLRRHTPDFSSCASSSLGSLYRHATPRHAIDVRERSLGETGYRQYTRVEGACTYTHPPGVSPIRRGVALLAEALRRAAPRSCDGVESGHVHVHPHRQRGSRAGAQTLLRSSHLRRMPTRRAHTTHPRALTSHTHDTNVSWIAACVGRGDVVALPLSHGPRARRSCYRNRGAT